MKTTQKRGSPAAQRRRYPGETGDARLTARLRRRTFRYLKLERFLEMSDRLLGKAV
ncbi:MAG: hypothetical protein HY550_04070 [Elusimicrobia bacterium]|nr:hypothetical protein [Elusimicrobiota bacterium]